MVKQNANDLENVVDEHDGKGVLKVLSRVIGDDEKDSGAILLLDDGSQVFVKEKDLYTGEDA